MVDDIERIPYLYCGRTDVLCSGREDELCTLLVVECEYKVKEPAEIKSNSKD